jgi:hypothetical protein
VQYNREKGKLTSNNRHETLQLKHIETWLKCVIKRILTEVADKYNVRMLKREIVFSVLHITVCLYILIVALCISSIY